MRQKRGTAGHRELLGRLTKARLDKNLTQAELAIQLQVAQTYVSKYEIGERRLDVVEFIVVCEQLELDPAKVIKAVAAVVQSAPPKIVPRPTSAKPKSLGSSTVRRGPRRKAT